MSDQSNSSLNAPKADSLDDWRSIISDKGAIAKTCKFLARITPSSGALRNVFNSGGKGGLYKDLTYLCETIEYPGRGFNNIDGIRYYGPSMKLPYQSNYEDINAVFLCREDMYERQLFDDWMELINPTNTFDFEYRDNYTAQIEIFKISDVEHKPEYAFTLRKAYPILVNPQPVTWTDEQFLRLGITFTYHWWTRKGLDKEPSSWVQGNFSNLVNVDVTQ